MSDLNWCTYCDKAINPLLDSLYCSEECLKADALNHHPLLGYDWHELKDFPRLSSPRRSPSLSSTTTLSSSSSSSLSPSLSSVLSYSLGSPELKLSEPAYRTTFHHPLSPPALELEPQPPNVKSSVTCHHPLAPCHTESNANQKQPWYAPNQRNPYSTVGSLFF